MRKILTGYVVNFNRRHRRYGHLFQNRYKSIKKESEALRSADRYKCFGAAGVLEIRYFPGRVSFRSRRRVVVEARGSISWIAVRELGYSGADVARYLGVGCKGRSCINALIT